MAVVRRSPQVFGYANVRWKLGQLLDVCDWLRLTSPGGLSQLLQRLGISYKRGRDYVHSPDRHYGEKLDLLHRCLPAGVLCAGALRVHLRRPIDLLSAAQSGAGL